MKKVLLFLFVIAAVTPMQAQNWGLAASNPEIHAVGTWTFAPKIGLNLTNLTNTDGKLKPGLQVGVTAEYRVSDVFAIEPGLFYSMQGCKVPTFHDAESGLNLDAKFKNDYLNIPVLAKAYVINGWNVFAGPQFGFLVSSKLKGSAGNTTVSVKTSEYYKKFDFSLVIGTGYQFDCGMLVSVSYNAGLSKILKENTVLTAGSDENSHNAVLQFTAGWRF